MNPIAYVTLCARRRRRPPARASWSPCPGSGSCAATWTTGPGRPPARAARTLSSRPQTARPRAFGGKENIRFGWGTALAARWSHGHSVDVDLFVEPDPHRYFHWNTGGRFILDIKASHLVARIATSRKGAEITFRDRRGHVSIASAPGARPGRLRGPPSRVACRDPTSLNGQEGWWLAAEGCSVRSRSAFGCPWTRDSWNQSALT